MPTASKPSKANRSVRFVIGTERFEKISAVEGITLTSAMKKRAASFDKRDLTAAERRRRIIEVHRKFSSSDV